MRSRLSKRRAGEIAGLAFFAALGLGSPSTARQSAPSVRESVAVSLVEVPVTVLDSKGAPVRGLALSDFRVLDDGKEVRPTGLDVTEFPPATHGADAPPPPERINPAAMRRFILLFDLSFVTPAELSRARAAAEKFIREQAGPEDLLCVGSISAKFGAHFMRGFTRSREEVEKGLDSLAVPNEIQTRTATISADDVMDGGKNDRFTAEEVYRLQQSGRAKDAARIDQMFSVLHLLADSMKRVDGRKQIIFFSHGFDVMVDDTVVLKPLADAMDALRRSDCVLHAVDIAGLREGRPNVNRAWGNTTQEALFTMASETGGQFVADSNDFSGQLDRVLQATQVVYVLTFPSSVARNPGRYHRLEVTCARAGVRVFARPGYEEPGPPK
jgi:VWFA-related protein